MNGTRIQSEKTTSTKSHSELVVDETAQKHATGRTVHPQRRSLPRIVESAQ
jgi:hypothetical protein